MFVRTSHTVLTLGVASTLIFKDTELSQSLHKWPGLHAVLYTSSFFLLLTLSLVFYFVTCLVKPGFVPLPTKRHVWESDEDEEISENANMLRESEEGQISNSSITVKLRRCGFCEVEQPLRSHHCEDCDRCILRYDHHCPWLETCIGERNHKYFWIFLILTSALILWTLNITWHAFVHKLYWGDWFRANAFFLIDLCVLLSGGLTVVGLACFHTYLMLSNQTTWEVVSRERITYLKNLREDLNPFSEGYCKNMYTFLCSMGAKRWEVLYKKYAAYQNSEA